jgi:hypothetical protein
MKFYVLQDDKIEPLEESELISLWKKGTLKGTDLVRTKESEEWAPLSQVISVERRQDQARLTPAAPPPPRSEPLTGGKSLDDAVTMLVRNIPMVWQFVALLVVVGLVVWFFRQYPQPPKEDLETQPNPPATESRDEALKREIISESRQPNPPATESRRSDDLSLRLEQLVDKMFESPTPATRLAARPDEASSPPQASASVATSATVETPFSTQSTSDLTPLKASVVDTASERLYDLGQEYDKAITQLKAFKNDRGIEITFAFNFDVEGGYLLKLQYGFRLLVRIFDANGMYLTHFTTREVFSVHQQWVEECRSVRARTIEGYVKSGLKPPVMQQFILLKNTDNVLRYPLNLRDLRDTSMIEIGFHEDKP